MSQPSICFFLGVYNDQELAKVSIQKLKLFYPQADIVSISDGVDSVDYTRFCTDHGVTYWTGERLKLMEHGGLWTARFLKAMLRTKADIFIKLDPDSGINYQLDSTAFPDADLFGNIREAGGRWHIQGGFIAFKRAAAQRILDSNLLGSAEYCTKQYSYSRFQFPYLQAGETPSPEWITVEDVILWNVVHKLQLKITNFDQVWCHYKNLCPDPSKYAVVHPAKELLVTQ